MLEKTNINLFKIKVALIIGLKTWTKNKKILLII